MTGKHDRISGTRRLSQHTCSPSQTRKFHMKDIPQFYTAITTARRAELEAKEQENRKRWKRDGGTSRLLEGR